MAGHNVTFIGLGAMGYNMAGNIRTKMPASGTLFIHDVVRDSCDRFVQEFGQLGPVQVVDTPREGVDQSDTVLTMVPRGADVREVYLEGAGAVVNATKADRLILECSTIDVQTTREVGKQIKEAGIGYYLDAPVSGGVIGAKNATLSFLIGHSHDDPLMRERIESIVKFMANSEKINFCGGLGNGLSAKICNNYLSFCNMLSIAEAMSIGIRLGVDKHTLFNCIKSSGGNSATFHNFQPCPGVIPHLPSSNGFKAGFRPLMIAKDLGLAVEAGKQTGIDAHMAQTALEMFTRAMEDPRCKDRDATSIWLMINGIDSVDGV